MKKPETADRQERIEVRFMADKSIRLYDKEKRTPISEWQVQYPGNIADTICTNALGKIYVYE